VSAQNLKYADLAGLPPVIPATLADQILGIGTTLGRQLRARGEYPVPVLAGLGRHHKVSTGALLAYLGLDAPGGRLPGLAPAPDAMLSASAAAASTTEEP
jgi:hypothetical protein